MDDDREVMDISEAADFLRVTRDTMYTWATKNKVPCFKIGNQWRFLRSSLMEWMKELERKNADPKH